MTNRCRAMDGGGGRNIVWKWSSHHVLDLQNRLLFGRLVYSVDMAMIVMMTTSRFCFSGMRRNGAAVADEIEPKRCSRIRMMTLFRGHCQIEIARWETGSELNTL